MQLLHPVTFDNHLTQNLYHLFAISSQYCTQTIVASVVFGTGGC